ncbi:UNVERIFIED_CONTAM: NADH dehydrogenase 1 beta subcomplex subunit 7 ndufb7 [Gekko kuhli]
MMCPCQTQIVKLKSVTLMVKYQAHWYVWDAKVEPDPLKMPTFNPQYGFPEHKEWVMIATQQQMNDAQLPLEERDYCAHYLIKLMKCKHGRFPNISA